MNTDLFPTHPIVLVDDEKEALAGNRFTLEACGLTHVKTLQDARDLLDCLHMEPASVVLLDLSMPHLSGQELLPQLVERHPETPVIIVTGRNEVDTAIACMRAGAFDYLVKPVDEARLTTAVRRAIDLGELRHEYNAFRQRVFTNHLEHPEAFSEIVTRNRTLFALFQYMEAIAGTNRTVLITGETGTGKELVARALHALSGGGPFVACNIAGVDDTVLSDTLFGHVRGAFTGAEQAREGLIGRARGGTLFLDEIGDLPAASQVKLLRLLQEREYLPLGADAARPLEARVIVATHQDLNRRQAEGTFRTDLYYRLRTHTIALPPLRERLDDLPLLVGVFLERAAEALGKPVPVVPPELYTLLATYDFPGNVRELESMVFEALSHQQGPVLSCRCFRRHMSEHGAARPLSATAAVPEEAPFRIFDRLPTLAEAPRLLIQEALRRSRGNQTVAAGLLGITRSGLNKAIKRYGLDGPTP